MIEEQANWVRNKIRDPIVESVRNKLFSRSQLGVKKYGTTIFDSDKDDYFKHLQEELMDASLYIEKIFHIKQHINFLVNCYSNDQELGKVVRQIYGNNK